MAEKKEEKKTEAKKAEKKVEKQTETKKTAAKKETKKPEKETNEKVKAAAAAEAEAKAVKEEVKEAEPLHPTLQKKKERREAKAARKEANRVEEQKSRPNNLLLGILIFGVLIGMFAFITGYKYFSKPATIEKYLEESGGAEMYENLQWDEYTYANISSDGNSMNIVFTADTDEEEAIAELKEYYGGEEGKENLLDVGAYFLSNMKPETRGSGADATVSMKLNGEELNSVKITYSEAKKRIKEQEKEAEEEAEHVHEEGEEHVHEEGEEHVHEEGEE